MTSNQDEVGFFDVVDPVEQQFPQCIHPLSDKALALQCNLLDLWAVPAGLRPLFDGGSCSVSESYRCTCGLAHNPLEDRGREEAMDAYGNGFLYPLRCRVDVQVRSRELAAQEVLAHLLPKARLLSEAVCRLELWKDEIWRLLLRLGGLLW